MEISFTNKKIAKICCSAKEMNAKHGKRMTEKLQQRLTELSAAETLADMRNLPGARCHELAGNLAGCLVLWTWFTPIDWSFRRIMTQRQNWLMAG